MGLQGLSMGVSRPLMGPFKPVFGAFWAVSGGSGPDLGHFVRVSGNSRPHFGSFGCPWEFDAFLGFDILFGAFWACIWGFEA